MLKEAKYPNWGYPAVGPEFGTVKYAIKGQKCYFSGVAKVLYEVTSTINAAEDIVKAIAAQEGVAITDLRFFDLQTHRSYDRPKGEFDFDEVIISIENGRLLISWQSCECPQDVIEMFQEYIGQQPSVDIWSPESACQSGFFPTTMRSPNVGSCQEYLRQLQAKTNLLQKLRSSAPRVALYAESMIGTPEFNRFIIVDSKKSGPNRFSVWSRDRIQEN